jgi:intein-encoded DNA endonuclease-like protein
VNITAYALSNLKPGIFKNYFRMYNIYLRKYLVVMVVVMVFNATFNNISAIMWWSVLLVEETGVP